jgi:protein involved in sex pheromone biosynthesis
MKKILLAAITAFALAATPVLADATDDKNKEWNVDVDLLRKLAKKKKCKQVIMYREVLPYFGKENTIKASKEITTQFEREDLASGRAIILHEKSTCNELLGNFFVMCTTDTALCYFDKARKAGKGKKLSLAKKSKTSARKKK